MEADSPVAGPTPSRPLPSPLLDSSPNSEAHAGTDEPSPLSSPTQQQLNTSPRGLRSLSGSPKDLWCTFLVKFLDSIAYFSLSLILTLYLTNEFGYNDVMSGTVYGIWGALVAIYGIVTGLILDQIGAVKAIKIGVFLSLLGRTVLLLVTDTVIGRTWLLIILLGVLPFATSMVYPGLVVAVRRYTDSKNRGFAFGLFYAAMNLAALLSGFMIDAFRKAFADENDDGSQDSVTSFMWTSCRCVLFMGVITTSAGLFTTAFMNEIKVEDDDEEATGEGLEQSESNEDQTASVLSGESSTSTLKKTRVFVPSNTPPLVSLRETLRRPSFWRFVVVGLIVTNIRMVFRHLDATLPKFMMREFGHDVPFGSVYAVNPATVIFLTPIVSAYMSEIHSLVMIRLGIFIGAFSILFLVIWPNAIWACVAFILFFSIGESIWAPRFYDYSISSSEEGKEGVFGAFAFAPLFLAQLPVGFISGLLLDSFCPSEDSCDGRSLWGVIAGIAALSPICMVILWPYINVHEIKDCDRNKDTANASDANETAVPRISELSEPLLHS